MIKLALLAGALLLIGEQVIVNETSNSPSIAIIIALQLSDNMDTQDMRHEGQDITRLGAAQQWIQQEIDTLPSYQPIGIIGFNETHRNYLIPPTTDHLFIKERIQRFHTNTYLSIPRGTSFIDSMDKSTLIAIGDTSEAMMRLLTHTSTIDIAAILGLGPSTPLTQERREGEKIECCIPTNRISNLPSLTSFLAGYQPVPYTNNKKRHYRRAIIMILLGL